MKKNSPHRRTECRERRGAKKQSATEPQRTQRKNSVSLRDLCVLCGKSLLCIFLLSVRLRVLCASAVNRISRDSNMARPRKTVALLVETSNEYARGLLHGVVSYVREHRPWSTYLAEHGRGDAPPTWLSNWSG